MFEVQQRRSIYSRVRNSRALGAARSGVTAMSVSTRGPSLHDWEARAVDALAEAMAMPKGQDRINALKKAGQLRVATDRHRIEIAHVEIAAAGFASKIVLSFAQRRIAGCDACLQSRGVPPEDEGREHSLVATGRYAKEIDNRYIPREDKQRVLPP
jgi:hypothetical protein